MTGDDVEAVLVTGVYGAGKSTVVADIGGMLERRGEHFGIVDVDWLGWFSAGESHDEHEQVVLSNLQTLCQAFIGRGVRRLALARSVKDHAVLTAMRRAVPAPMRVVRLEVDQALVERRLSVDPTEERRIDDLRVAQEWLSAGHGEGLEDLVLPGDRPPRETSEAICSWLGWT